jgi:hypothetical protein
MENIRGHRPEQRQRGLKKRLRLLEQSLNDKICQKQSLNDKTSQNMANIRGQIRTKTERTKEETEAVGTVIGWQNVENIRGHRPGQGQRGLKKRLRLLEQSLDDKIWQMLEARPGKR